jgi:hypothetical protein
MKKGEAKIEFFTNLKYLQNEYNNGLVIAKFLYEKAVREKNFKMKYWQFNKYFNDILAGKKIVIKEPVIISPAEDNLTPTVDEAQGPIKASINTKEKKVFSALYGKKVDDGDLL